MLVTLMPAKPPAVNWDTRLNCPAEIRCQLQIASLSCLEYTREQEGACARKNPSRHYGQEGCVWLEKVAESYCCGGFWAG